MTVKTIDALFDEFHEDLFEECPLCTAALDEKNGDDTFLGMSYRLWLRQLHDRQVRAQNLIDVLFKTSAQPGEIVTYQIEREPLMTEHIPMTREAAEVQLTRELGFRVDVVKAELERVSFLEDDVANVTATEPISLDLNRLWRRAVANLKVLGDAEQRERELLVQIKTIADELEAGTEVTQHAKYVASQLRALLPATDD